MDTNTEAIFPNYRRDTNKEETHLILSTNVIKKHTNGKFYLIPAISRFHNPSGPVDLNEAYEEFILTIHNSQEHVKIDLALTLDDNTPAFKECTKEGELLVNEKIHSKEASCANCALPSKGDCSILSGDRNTVCELHEYKV